MPWHSHPFLRDMERAKESTGWFEAENSVGYNVVTAAENAGTMPPPSRFVGASWYFAATTQAHTT